MQKDVVTIHTDGGARGNPGPAACSFVVEEGGKIVDKGSKFLGSKTNNYAEYQGVVLALRWVKNNKEVVGNHGLLFLLDSELVVKQINGIYKVKEVNLKKLIEEINTLRGKIKLEISFRNIPREKNKLADFLVNEELDRNV